MAANGPPSPYVIMWRFQLFLEGNFSVDYTMKELYLPFFSDR